MQQLHDAAGGNFDKQIKVIGRVDVVVDHDKEITQSHNCTFETITVSSTHPTIAYLLLEE